MWSCLRRWGPSSLPLPLGRGGLQAQPYARAAHPAHGDRLRVFYAFDQARSAVLLIGGNKTVKDKRFYKTIIPRADVLYDEHLKNLQAQPKP